MIIYKRDNIETKCTFLQLREVIKKGDEIKWPQIYRSRNDELEYIFTLTNTHLIQDTLSNGIIRRTEITDINTIREIITS